MMAIYSCGCAVWLLCRYYGYMYGHWLPKELLGIVSQLQVCEDILFNFLVAHVIRHPPIKLAQRHSASQSASFAFDQLRLPTDGIEAQKKLSTRHYCLNRFAEEFGYMPLLRSEVRYDPLLYKDNVSVLRKKYRHMENPLLWLSAMLIFYILFNGSYWSVKSGKGQGIWWVRENQGTCKITWKVCENCGIAHRWVENVPVIEGLIDILLNLKEYVKCVDKKLKIWVQNC